MNSIRNTLTGAACIFALHASLASAQNATVTFNVPGPANWNVAGSWTSEIGPVVPGDGFPTEVASISNGGTAFLDQPAGFNIDGLIIGQAVPGAQAGTLELRAGGSLTVQDNEGAMHGEVRVGDGATGRGILDLQGGTLNAASLNVSGTGNPTSSSLRVSGSSTINVSGDVTLFRHTRIVGPNVNFNVGGNLQISRDFEAVITGATHSAIKVPDGSVSIVPGGTQTNLSVTFQGVTPTLGDHWTLVDAASVSGEFPVITSTGALPRGMVLGAVYANGNVDLVPEARLVLTVNRGTGAVSMTNALGGAITLDSYTIGSASGFLNPANGGWTSLDDANNGAWEEANPTNTRISELNPTGSSTLNVNQSLSLGSPYTFAPTEIGQVGAEDITFEYGSPTGEKYQGIVEYTGPQNNLVLVVDPATGNGVLQNQSKFTVDMDVYTIASASGSLNVSGWNSLEDQNIGAWEEANPTAARLTELNPTGASTLASGASFSLGNLFMTSGTRDLTLEFALSDGRRIIGAVDYGVAETGQVGDTDADGDVDLDDLNAVRNNFGTSGPAPLPGDAFPFDGTVDLDDLNAVRNNFGATAGSAVPEPSAGALALVVIGAAFASRRRAI